MNAISVGELGGRRETPNRNRVDSRPRVRILSGGERGTGGIVKLSPFFKYFGSKCRSAARYPEPKHDTIIEPFCGGAGYSLNYPERQVVLSDSDKRVATVWQYLIDASPDEIMALPLMEPGQHIRTLDVSEPARLFISCCVNSSQFRNVLTQWKNGQNDGLWGPKWRKKVARQVTEIKHWRVACHEYDHVENSKATWFIDPPYAELDEHYAASRRNGIDYTHLADWCNSRHGQVIVCEQGGATWLPFRHLGEFAAVRNAGGRSCQEAIWTAENAVAVECRRRVEGQQVTLF